MLLRSATKVRTASVCDRFVLHRWDLLPFEIRGTADDNNFADERLQTTHSPVLIVLWSQWRCNPRSFFSLEKKSDSSRLQEREKEHQAVNSGGNNVLIPLTCSAQRLNLPTVERMPQTDCAILKNHSTARTLPFADAPTMTNDDGGRFRSWTPYPPTLNPPTPSLTRDLICSLCVIAFAGSP